ncbi:MAG: D-aminoacylase, partial [Chloroflexota bacterium]|nr:D-aminoacylase [Chloroflexota bacterium]
MLDILIYGGSILDGSGNPAYGAAIGITGDRISIHREDVSLLEAGRKIDAKGYIVAPGFVDLHSHAGLTILGSPHHEPKVRQG